MLFSNQYREIKHSSQGIYKEKGSKFIAYAYPVYSEKEVQRKLLKIKKIEHSARHYCYAFVLNTDKSGIRSNDDGEPSYTAGKPILKQIQANDLTNILIIVVRYFGGIKLGIPGLIRSYKTAAINAISNAIIITKTIKEIYEIRFEYSQIENIMKVIKRNKIEIVKSNLDLNCVITCIISKSDADNIIRSFKKNYKLTIKYLKTI